MPRQRSELPAMSARDRPSDRKSRSAAQASHMRSAKPASRRQKDDPPETRSACLAFAQNFSTTDPSQPKAASPAQFQRKSARHAADDVPAPPSSRASLH